MAAALVGNPGLAVTPAIRTRGNHKIRRGKRRNREELVEAGRE